MSVIKEGNKRDDPQNESSPELLLGSSSGGSGNKNLFSNGCVSSESDFFSSFMSAMHLNGYNSSSRKRKFLERSSGKSSWLRGNNYYSTTDFHPYSFLQSPEAHEDEVDEPRSPSRKGVYPSATADHTLVSGVLSDIVDENLAADFDDSLTGLGDVTAAGSVSEALLALPNLSISNHQVDDDNNLFKEPKVGNHAVRENKGEDNTLLSFESFNAPSKEVVAPISEEAKKSDEVPASLPTPASTTQYEDNQFEYMLMAASSIATKLHEPSITYLNQGVSYELRLRKLGDLSTYRKRLLRTQVRICFHERRLQYSEAEQIGEWSSSHPGERILDLDIANSYGILHRDFSKETSGTQLNVLSFKWDPTRDTAVSIKVNCISTEFTPKKHGGEKGVPFRLQVETYDDSPEEGGTSHDTSRRLHAAGCILQIFKLKGADRKHKQDREKIAKKSPEEQENYAKPCKTTVLKDLAIDSIYIPQSSSSNNDNNNKEDPSSPQDNNVVSNTNSELKETKSYPSKRRSDVGEEFILGNYDVRYDRSSSEDALPSSKKPATISPSPIPSPPPSVPHNPSQTQLISITSTAQEINAWLSEHRFTSCNSIFTNYDGRDILRLSREELFSLLGPPEGIRLYNALHSLTIPPRSTFYIAQKDSTEFHALFLEGYSVSEFIRKFAGILGVQPEVFHSLLLVGPLGILVKVTDSVVRYMRPETIFYFTLRSSSESPLEACDIILEEVSALLQQEEENTNASPTIQQQAEEQDDGTAVVDPSSIRVS